MNEPVRYSPRVERQLRCLQLTEERKCAIASKAAETIYRLGRKTGRRFVSRNTVSRTKILRALHNASREVLGEQDYDYYATYRTFDIDANSAIWKTTLAMLKLLVDVCRREWLADTRTRRMLRLRKEGEK